MTIGKTIKLNLDRWQVPPAMLIAALVFVVAGSISAAGRYTAEIGAATVPTPALPYILIATPRPEHPPVVHVAAQTGPTLPRAIIAYDSPDGQPIGALDSGRAYTVVARWGDGWIQADVQGSGVVWIKTTELLDTSNVADVRPAPTAPPLPEPPAPAPVFVYSPPTPEPPVYVDEPPPPPPPDERQQNIQDRLANEHVGGSGKMDAPNFGTMDSAATWCASVQNGARCVSP